jgi:hypothetical protein
LEVRNLFAGDLFVSAWGDVDLDGPGLFAGGGGGKNGGGKNSTVSSLVVTPGTLNIETGATQQFQVKAYDQRGSLISPTPSVQWTATGGLINSSGLFTAGGQAGPGSVKVTSGTISSSVTISIVSSSTTSNSQPTFQTPELAQLIDSLYADQKLDRAEMINVLRSLGADAVVTQAEISDVRSLVASSYYAMPRYVRELSRDVVNDNPANLRFQGQPSANLTAGSSSALLNQLIDSWFYGADLPAINSYASTYTLATGNMLATSPSLNDAKQGMVGDCYLIAALSAIAYRNPKAIQDMFLDNGDGTYTVRFFGISSTGVRVPDFVTVNRMLPTNSSGILSYAGYGFSATSSSTILWMALAEKAYAQWNETGASGRNGTNSYSGIEGGWMHNVNAQVLGYSSTNYSLSNTTAQTMITALQNGLAVTAGTLSSVTLSGLVAGHAYTVVGYDSSTSRFQLHNPWGYQHPSPLTWAQLQANFSIFTTTEASGSNNTSGNGFHSTDQSQFFAPVILAISNGEHSSQAVAIVSPFVAPSDAELNNPFATGTAVETDGTNQYEIEHPIQERMTDDPDSDSVWDRAIVETVLQMELI